jgi:Zn-finger nucleic acid-binding protein
MAAVKVGIVEVDRCTSCGGMWFDSLEEEWLETPARDLAHDGIEDLVRRWHGKERV